MVFQESFFGKRAKERREQRREARRQRRERRRELRMRKKESKVKRLETQIENQQLDNQAKQAQVNMTSRLAEAEISGQGQSLEQNKLPNNPQNRNQTMWIVGGVLLLLVIGAIIFFVTQKD
jgi:predicted RNase H-like nuclease (RuvC/YqgF family)